MGRLKLIFIVSITLLFCLFDSCETKGGRGGGRGRSQAAGGKRTIQ